MQLPPAGSTEEMLDQQAFDVSIEEALDILSRETLDPVNSVSEADNLPPTAPSDAGRPVGRPRIPGKPRYPGMRGLPQAHQFRLLEDIPSAVAPMHGDDDGSSSSSSSIHSVDDGSSIATLSVDGDEEDDPSLQVGDSRHDSIQQGSSELLPRVAAAVRSDRGAQSSSPVRKPTFGTCLHRCRPRVRVCFPSKRLCSLLPRRRGGKLSPCTGAVPNDGEVDTQAGRGERWLDLAGRLVRGDSCLAFLHASALKVDKVIRAAGLR